MVLLQRAPRAADASSAAQPSPKGWPARHRSGAPAFLAALLDASNVAAQTAACATCPWIHRRAQSRFAGEIWRTARERPHGAQPPLPALSRPATRPRCARERAARTCCAAPHSPPPCSPAADARYFGGAHHRAAARPAVPLVDVSLSCAARHRRACAARRAARRMSLLARRMSEPRLRRCAVAVPLRARRGGGALARRLVGSGCAPPLAARCGAPTRALRVGATARARCTSRAARAAHASSRAAPARRACPPRRRVRRRRLCRGAARLRRRRRLLVHPRSTPAAPRWAAARSAYYPPWLYVGPSRQHAGRPRDGAVFSSFEACATPVPASPPPSARPTAPDAGSLTGRARPASTPSACIIDAYVPPCKRSEAASPRRRGVASSRRQRRHCPRRGASSRPRSPPALCEARMAGHRGRCPWGKCTPCACSAVSAGTA